MTANTRYTVTVMRTETKSTVVFAPSEQAAIDMVFQMESDEPNSPMLDCDCDTVWFGEEVQP